MPWGGNRTVDLLITNQLLYQRWASRMRMPEMACSSRGRLKEKYADSRNRTVDPIITNDVLYQLS